MFKKVINKKRYKTANPFYYYIRSDDTDYLFAQSQLDAAAERAQKNQEDIAGLDLIDDSKIPYIWLINGILIGAASVVGGYGVAMALGLV